MRTAFIGLVAISLLTGCARPAIEFVAPTIQSTNISTTVESAADNSETRTETDPTEQILNNAVADLLSGK